MELIMGWFIHI